MVLLFYIDSKEQALPYNSKNAKKIPLVFWERNKYVVKTTLVPIRNMKLLFYWRSISKASIGGIEDEEIIHTFPWYNDDDDGDDDDDDGGDGWSMVA